MIAVMYDWRHCLGGIHGQKADDPEESALLIVVASPLRKLDSLGDGSRCGHGSLAGSAKPLLLLVDGLASTDECDDGGIAAGGRCQDASLERLSYIKIDMFCGASRG